MSGPAPARAEGWVSAWEGALDGLELDVERAEALLRAVHAGEMGAGATPATAAWLPLSRLGPLPESMLDRARQVHTRQLSIAGEIASAVVRSRRELALVRRLTGPAPASRPMFVDASV